MSLNTKIRIIGGKFKGKTIEVLSTQHLRPTPNRIRETLFNWLMHDIQGSSCLDAFAGSGALGFEAFSRGAAHVTLIEAKHSVFCQLKKQSIAFNAPQLEVFNQNAVSFLASVQTSFDIIFLDPPFSEPQLLEDCIKQIEAFDLLTANGYLYIETSHQHPPQLNRNFWTTYREKSAGQVIYSLHQKKITDSNPIPLP